MSSFPQKKAINIRGKLFDLSLPRVMGILNITPDSFYDGGRYSDEPDYLKQADKIISQGAHIIDIGGYSSRPGAENINSETELKRILPAVKQIRQKFPETIISVDTFRAEVAEKVIEAGADIINDISAGELDTKMPDFIASNSVPYVIMHMKGNPQNMQNEVNYQDVVKELLIYFSIKIEKFHSKGIKDLIIDPGFGFGKSIKHNFEILNNLEKFHIFGVPILVGLSRKSMIYKTLEITPEESLNGTTVLNTIALQKGANILRVHDVKEAIETIKLVNLPNYSN